MYSHFQKLIQAHVCVYLDVLVYDHMSIEQHCGRGNADTGEPSMVDLGSACILPSC